MDKHVDREGVKTNEQSSTASAVTPCHKESDLGTVFTREKFSTKRGTRHIYRVEIHESKNATDYILVFRVGVP